ncbi:ribonuclease III domain-containing protein [Macrophomina phaseolina]|uniref:Ribonuclease III domain-containing protein n=1 Tax=Macrophomina phaseolina TaxID=35725 RepID=A0ABQ8GC94_9PEZI|nr:ribonuclease III domain-containing protein [Macrophomina phaseolina]
MTTNGKSGDKAGAGAKRPLAGDASNDNPKKRMAFDISANRSTAPNLYETNARSPPQDIPALPAIRDPANVQAVFTHPSATKYRKYSYNRLEFYGDAVIELAATDLVWDTYPELNDGRLSQVRETLVNNGRLASFSMWYGFDKRLQRNCMEEWKEAAWVKVLGDVFEAYIGALAIEDRGTNSTRAQEWLRELWKPLLLDSDVFFEEDEQLQEQVKSEANRLFAPSASGLKASYKDIKQSMKNKAQQNFCVGLYLDGSIDGSGYNNLELGVGEGQSKKIARARAAKNALARAKTDPALKKLTEKTEKFLAGRVAAREKAEAEAKTKSEEE